MVILNPLAFLGWVMLALAAIGAVVVATGQAEALEWLAVVAFAGHGAWFILRNRRSN